jgi:branched-chain amino acid transport system substrate-binding protein
VQHLEYFSPASKTVKGTGFLDLSKTRCKKHSKEYGVNSRSIAILACSLLLAVPLPTASAPRDDKGNVLRALASRVGRVLGAAAACSDVAPQRVKGIADKITDVIKTSAGNEDEGSSILDVFHKSQSDGAQSVTAKKVDCASADRELSDLEAASAPSPQISNAPQAPAQTMALSGPGTAGALRGITDSEIRFGISAPFSGPSKDLGHQMRLGIETAFRLVNDAGGVNGRALRLVTADDGYEPSRTGDTMKQLYEKDQVFGFVGNVGTPTAMVAAPFALERRMLFFGAFTGANVLRHDPPDRYVFNYRASYAEETDAVVRYLVKVRRLKPEQVAVFAQQDAFGDAGFAGVNKALRTLRGGDGGFILRVGYPRNTLDVDTAIAQVRANKTPIKAVVMVATYRAAAKFIEKTRDSIPGLIYTNVSFVGSTSLRDELMLLGPKYATGVIVTQVVPAVDGYSSLILEYKSALAKYFGGEAPDYVSFEGYVAAQVLIEALKRAGPQLDTEKVVNALENLRDFDMGLGAMINFGKSEHQGSHKVWGTQLSDSGKYEAFELQ